MYRIDNATAITPIPAPAAVGPNPNCFFTKGNPGIGTPATIVDDDWANAVQEEICNVITAAGITLNKTVRSQLLSSIQTLTRTKLTGATTFYVTAAGNDATGTGAIGAPWLTLQKAVSAILLGYDFGGYAVTVNVGAGTFAGANVFGPGAGQNGIALVITGAGAGTTIINSTITAAYGAFVSLQSMTITTPGVSSVVATELGRITINAGVTLGGAGAGTMILRAQLCSLIQIGANLTISGGGSSAFYAENNSAIFSNAVTVTLTGTPAFTSAFANAQGNGSIVCGNLIFSGAATGPRYLANLNGMIGVNGGGANFFPGNSAGSVTNGGQYA